METCDLVGRVEPGGKTYPRPLYMGEGRNSFKSESLSTGADLGINRHFPEYDVIRRQRAWGKERCSEISDSGGGVQAKKRHTHGLYVAGEEVE